MEKVKIEEIRENIEGEISYVIRSSITAYEKPKLKEDADLIAREIFDNIEDIVKELYSTDYLTEYTWREECYRFMDIEERVKNYILSIMEKYNLTYENFVELYKDITDWIIVYYKISKYAHEIELEK